MVHPADMSPASQPGDQPTESRTDPVVTAGGAPELLDEAPLAGRTFEGRYLVGLLLLLGVLAAVATTWWHARQIAQCREFWGPEGSAAIRGADRVEGWKLEPLAADQIATPDDTVTVGDRRWRVIDRVPVVSGVLTPLTLARRATMFDYTFDWDKPVTCQPEYEYALVFWHDPEPGSEGQSGSVGTTDGPAAAGARTTILYALQTPRPYHETDCVSVLHLETGRTLTPSRAGRNLLRDAMKNGFDHENGALPRP